MALHLADLLGEHWANYAHAHRHQLNADHYRAVRRVLACRTADLGGRLYQCGDCKKKQYAYDKQGNVLLYWTSSSTGKTAVMALHPHEFIRRWLLHVLPKGLTRIRHYGYLGFDAPRRSHPFGARRVRSCPSRSARLPRAKPDSASAPC